MTGNIVDPEREAILQSLGRLEERIVRLEAHLGLAAPESGSALDGIYPAAAMPALAEEEPELEQRIGEYGLAWAGSIVFLLGFVFLMTFTLNQGYSLLSAAMGYLASAGIYLLGRVWQRSFFYLARILTSASLLLAFYTTLRLHYFTSNPLVESHWIAFPLLIASAFLPLIVAWRNGSQTLAVLPVILLLMSALLSDKMHVMLSLTVVQAGLATHLGFRRNWWYLLNGTIGLVYLAHMLWLINNPVAGHAIRAIAGDQYALVYLFACAAIFAWPTLFFDRSASTDPSRIGVVFLNCLGCSATLSLAVLALYPRETASIALAAFVMLFACSSVQWLRTHVQFAASVYACFSYLALTIAIYGFARIPEAFLWLALQSFLVVSMALWFRSRALVVVNAVIYFGLLLTYWLISPESDWVNFSFAGVALLSARVMNWKKDRLTLRTEGLRNTYLGATFLMVLYALYHAVPPSYVALSWTLSAATYFLLSLLLRNVKYRWMSLLTLMATVGYLFLVDLARLDLRFRVVAFLFLGLMTVGISLFYTRHRRRSPR